MRKEEREKETTYYDRNFPMEIIQSVKKYNVIL